MSTPGKTGMIAKVLLICGIASSVVYVAATILGAMQWDGYNWFSQSVSELFALDAPSRSLVAAAFVAYGVLVIAFGLGVLMSAGRSQPLRVAGATLVGYGIIGETGPFFYSLHTIVRGVQGTPNDTMHGIVTVLLVLLILLSVGFGAAAFGRRFRWYSIGTMLIIVVFGIVAGLDAPRMAANLPTPWLGVTERINIFGFMLWVMVLAVGLLRAPQQYLVNENNRKLQPV